MPVTINGTTGVVTPGATIGSINGILKSSSGVVSQAVSGTDFSSGIQGAKAWVNFNGTTSPGTIRSSYNVSSITKNGTGDYTVNFATPMADADYSATGTCSVQTGESQLRGVAINQNGVTGQTTSFVRLYVADSNGTIDRAVINTTIFGN